MSTRAKNITKNVIFITKAIESMEDPLHEGEFPVYKWSIQMWGEREDGSWEDPSYYISRVVFDLHPSFLQPRRGKFCCVLFVVLSKAPYTVREKGWGEFGIEVEVLFTDPSVPHFKTQIPLVFESVNETREVISFKAAPSSFKQILSNSGADASQQPSTTPSFHSLPIGMGDVATLSHRIRTLGQDQLRELVQIVKEASMNDTSINVVQDENGSFVDYKLNLYDLPEKDLERIAQVIG